jgi:hypothetical protein
MDEYRFDFPYIDIGSNWMGLRNRGARRTVFVHVSSSRNLSIPLHDSSGNGWNSCRSMRPGDPPAMSHVTIEHVHGSPSRVPVTARAFTLRVSRVNVMAVACSVLLGTNSP